MIEMFRSVGFALNGIAHALDRERNFRFQWLCGLVVFLISAFVEFVSWQDALIIIMVFVVLAAELLNSAIENLCDSTGHEVSDAKRIAKDCAAAAVLLLACAAALVFVAFVGPHLNRIFANLSASPWPVFAMAFIIVANLPHALSPSPSIFRTALTILGLVISGLVLIDHHERVIFVFLTTVFHAVWALAVVRSMLLAKRDTKACA